MEVGEGCESGGRGPRHGVTEGDKEREDVVDGLFRWRLG